MRSPDRLASYRRPIPAVSLGSAPPHKGIGQEAGEGVRQLAHTLSQA